MQIHKPESNELEANAPDCVYFILEINLIMLKIRGVLCNHAHPPDILLGCRHSSTSSYLSVWLLPLCS